MTFAARPYQVECIEAVGREFNAVDSSLVVMATGLGKTVVLSHIARQWHSGGVLVIAHRDELITQARNKIQAITGHWPYTEKAETTVDSNEFWTGSNVIVTSAQSMGQTSDKRRARVFKWAGARFGGIRLVVVDEAHRFAPNTQYDRIVRALRDASPVPVKLLGVTATPRRTDQRSLGSVFESCAYQYGIADAIRDGWLVPIQQSQVFVNGLDFSKLKSRRQAGTGEVDFSDAELQAILMEEESLHEMALGIQRYAGDRQGIVFCAGVEHAQAMATVLRRYYGSDCCDCVHGGTPAKQRSDSIDRYQRGELRFLTNCGVFTEGFDAPATSFIACARPTKSLLLYTQMIGRGTRPLGGVVDGLPDAEQRRAAIAASAKRDCLVLDFVGNASRHKLVNTIDVLGGDMPAEQRDAALSLALNGTDVSKALGLVGSEAALMKEITHFKRMQARDESALITEMRIWNNEHRRRGIVADGGEMAACNVDPFDGQCTGAYTRPTRKVVEPPFRWQVALLVKAGWSPRDAAALSRGQAFGMIKRLRSKVGT